MNITEYIILFTTQILQSCARSWNIRCLASESRLMAHVSWQVYGIVWIASLSLGVKAMMETDWLGIALWFIGSGIGLELGQRMKK